MLSFLSPLNYVSSNSASQTKHKKQSSSGQGSEDGYVTRAARTLSNGAGAVGSALALAFLPTANAAPNGGSGGHGSSGGHGDGSSGHGDGSASGSDAGHTSEFGSGTRDSGRTSSGLSSGNGLGHWNGVPAFILLDDGGAGDICQTMAFQSKNGSEFAMAGCDTSRMNHVKSALEQVCGASFNVTENPGKWPVIGSEFGITYAAKNNLTVNTTDAGFVNCIQKNGDASQGLSDGAIVGITFAGIAAALVAAVAVTCACLCVKDCVNDRSESRARRRADRNVDAERQNHQAFVLSNLASRTQNS